ncbi:RDD family protein [Ktedonosporobacter rubrisoli]|uniref:RDD family protein n=1 Tax=Ktedonosporobacter rubrisoli TaxID=2509675 RepID=A0A4P6JWT1_KTERU|nr:RDD family protein [Ktedonosporobacter rubrisoli]QBD79862.1 RDD family protein [Ktedonosporobacter rubrisoli]
MAIAAPALVDVHILQRRILATILDGLAIMLIMFLVNMFFGTMYVTGGSVPGDYTVTYSTDWPWYFVVAFAYFFLFELILGQTPGKSLCGLMVVDLNGQRLTLRTALIRNLLRYVDAFPGFYLVGGIVMLNTSQRQRLGDIVAGTLVVRRSSVPTPTLTTGLGKTEKLVAAVCLLVLFACACYGYFTRPARVIDEMSITQNPVFGDAPMLPHTLKLANPSWGIGTVTYPIEYKVREADGIHACHGQIELHFNPIGGWGLPSGNTNCNKKI